MGSVWTQFWDMHSGGYLKTQWIQIYIEAPEDRAVEIFEKLFGQRHDDVACERCGKNFSVYSGPLDQITGYHRGCFYDAKEGRYKEIKRRGYVTLEEYMKRTDVRFINTEEIAQK
jgi:hypothetical protein